MPTGRLATEVRSCWGVVLGAVTAVGGQCLRRRGWAGWADMAGGGGAKAAVVLTLPAGSEVAGKWGVGFRGGGEGIAGS